jgi:hypothetical protein
MVGQRLDTLLTMMGAEQERHASQQNGECPEWCAAVAAAELIQYSARAGGEYS